jgi:uncharacterized protein (UPF0332 family)
MKDEKQASIQLKLTKARLLLSEVSILQQYQLNETAINRLYYACFHATKALLLTKDLIPKTHSGAVSMLHKHFVLQRVFDETKPAFFSKLMQERIDDDYNDFISVDNETVKEFTEPAKQYIDCIEELIKEDE